MLSFQTPSVYQSSKCFVTYGTMPHPDAKELPSKWKPWSTLLGEDFIHKVDLVISQASLERIKENLNGNCPVHHRIIMKLGDIIDGDFFTEYIKIGDILMRSEGRIGVDNVFTVKDGTLTLYLDKETYERAGLIGEPHGVLGKRGLRPRWIVTYNLRSTASFRGKKGFDRLVYACKNVLNHSVTWLFCNLSKTPNPDPLQKHSPTKYTSLPFYSENLKAYVPALEPPQTILTSSGRVALSEFATNIYEWLSLLRLQSPRVDVGNIIDPYLSRYAIPGEPEEFQEATLCKVSWQGFIPPTWTRQTLVDVILGTSSRTWFSLSVASFGKGPSGDAAECTVLRPPNSPGEYFQWEIHGHE